MNSNDCDHPDLTAHLLGELDAEHAEAMARWIESSPEACAEAGKISNLAQLLSETAPPSYHTLRPEQRAAVLSGPQRVRQMVAAVQQPKHRTAGVPLIWGAMRLAAAAALAIAGYVVGVNFGSRPGGSTSVASQPVPGPVEKKAVPKTTPFRAKEIPAPVIAEESTPRVEQVPVKAPEPKTEVVVVTPPPVALLPVPAQPKPVVVLARNDFLNQSYVNTSKNGVAQLSLRPSLTRPVAVEAGAPEGPVFGAPMSGSAKKDTALAARPSKQPDLLIHSWKAEVVSCPWDESHRLVRLVVQIPGEQPAAASAANSYPLQMNFSPGAVRSFRQLGERTVPALQADSAAFHIAWFEVVPNGPLAEGGTRTLGDIVLPNARFTTQAMAPFDSSRLRVLDRGASWQTAREDFLFESSLIGFHLLMKGEAENGSLNHALVLDLAQRAKLDEHNTEYTKFIRLVKDAGRMAGLK